MQSSADCSEGLSAQRKDAALQRHRHQTKGGVWILGALVPVVVVAIAAIVALTPGQVLAETEPEEADESVCDGLSPLTMGVNTLTLQRQGELTKHRQSMDGKCRMSLTLVDVSSEDHPADRTKTCTVTATPRVYGKVVEIVPSESGECDTVDYYIDLAFADDYASDSTWGSHSGFAEDEEAAPDGQGVSGASGCFYTARAEYPHRSGRGTYRRMVGGGSRHQQDVRIERGCPSGFRGTAALRAIESAGGRRSSSSGSTSAQRT